ncbi:MAG: DNA mismatch repair endonuclease MutL [Gemmatimonadota bacterium]|nr:DNA mismatch repair endonuclease MutL [Gemmatimonadota bacterium]
MDVEPRIRILADHVANQISAGEVVERPASVVKELVENALDAGARSIDIELRNGGKTLIRVTDDGEGMGRADALLALDRHATSKIRHVEDLASVASFGFRGEALPSIAAVSRFELVTSPLAGGPGTEVRVESGRILSSNEAARQPGTTVTVRSLFHSVPARAKFLRKSAAETRAASEAVVLLALVNLPVGFRLTSNGRELMNLAPVSSPADRVAELWGAAEAAGLLAIDREAAGIRVAGLIQRPDEAKPAGGRRYLFVNGRPFRDRALLKVVDDAYRTTVASDLRPSVFLYLGVPAGGVDVNVHPSKAQVRFQDEDAVYAAVFETVRSRLADITSTPVLRERTVGPSLASQPDVESPAGASDRTPPPQLALFVSRAEADSAVLEQVSLDPAIADRDPARSGPWQIQDAYILMPTRGGLLVIDQHSAHERILYEQTMQRFAGAAGESQRLLFPITLRLSPPEYSAAEELAGMLRVLGFEFEGFGERTLIVHAVPLLHPRFDAEASLRAVIHELAHGSELVNSARNQHERIAKSLACKAAIKAGQRLARAEMQDLVDRLFATELPGHDVHGRPTVLRLTPNELARRFGRS